MDSEEDGDGDIYLADVDMDSLDRSNDVDVDLGLVGEDHLLDDDQWTDRPRQGRGRSGRTNLDR